MLASTVHIKQSNIRKGTWVVSYEDLPYEYEDQENLSGMGFYHYNREKGEQAAFDTLKQHLIDRHKTEIERLTKSMEALERLESGFATAKI